MWSLQLADLAVKIHGERAKFIDLFTPVFLKHYAAISGNAEDVQIKYRSDLAEGNFTEVLKANEEKDRRSSYTNVGTHKDDLRLKIAGHPLKKFGSQGQQKTYLIALKLAQFDLIKETTKRVPILLLDDIFDKIDDVRVQHLMKLVTDHRFGQIFITDTHAERISNIFREISESVKIFDVSGGKVNEKN